MPAGRHVLGPNRQVVGELGGVPARHDCLGACAAQHVKLCLANHCRKNQKATGATAGRPAVNDTTVLGLTGRSAMRSSAVWPRMTACVCARRRMPQLLRLSFDVLLFVCPPSVQFNFPGSGCCAHAWPPLVSLHHTLCAWKCVQTPTASGAPLAGFILAAHLITRQGRIPGIRLCTCLSHQSYPYTPAWKCVQTPAA